MTSSLFFYDPLHDFDRLFEEAFNARTGPTNDRPHHQSVLRRGLDNAVARPKMDVHENKEANTVTATFELPGMTKENVDISVHDGRLTISGETKQSSDTEEGGYVVKERRYGKFSRTLQLPYGVKGDQITASLEHGVLQVCFPRTTPDLAPARITIA